MFCSNHLILETLITTTSILCFYLPIAAADQYKYKHIPTCSFVYLKEYCCLYDASLSDLMV